jgi:hypothetical protein
MEGVFAESTHPSDHLDDAFRKRKPSITVGLLPRPRMAAGKFAPVALPLRDQS